MSDDTVNFLMLGCIAVLAGLIVAIAGRKGNCPLPPGREWERTLDEGLAEELEEWYRRQEERCKSRES